MHGTLSTIPPRKSNQFLLSLLLKHLSNGYVMSLSRQFKQDTLNVVQVDGVRLCHWTAATNGPFVRPQIICQYGNPRRNDIDRRKPKNSEKTLFQCHSVHRKSPDANPGLRCERPATNRLSHGTTYSIHILLSVVMFLLTRILRLNTVTLCYLSSNVQSIVLPWVSGQRPQCWDGSLTPSQLPIYNLQSYHGSILTWFFCGLKRLGC
jgi:hypothetical protein